MRASEVAQALNVPTVYIEEELELLAAGANGQYGLLRRLDDGRYAINIVLFDRDEAERAFAIYTERLPLVSDTIAAFVEKNKAAYLAYPYLNRKVDLNLILWQQVFFMAQAFSEQVERILAERYFADVQEPSRPYSVYGYRFFGKEYGCGWDGTSAENLCGYARVRADNIYISRIRKHFSCGRRQRAAARGAVRRGAGAGGAGHRLRVSLPRGGYAVHEGSRRADARRPVCDHESAASGLFRRAGRGRCGGAGGVLPQDPAAAPARRMAAG